jgi:hypothetical protein
MAKSDLVLVKKAHQQETYTEKQIREIAAACDPITGPHYFLDNFFMIQHPTKGQMLYHPYDYQKGLIDTYHNYRFSVCLLSRQLGKSVTAAGYLLWYAMYVPDSTILIAAHKFSGAQEIMQRIRYAYEFCPTHMKAGVTSYNKGSIEFDNGSRIVSQATTENTGRGMAITLLYSDELAFVRRTIANEFWTSISPTLATGGKAIITSTPNSDEDQFWELWLGANKCVDEFGNETALGINGFKAYKAYWHQHPDRDAKWAAEELGRIGHDRFEREHNLRPVTADETLIAATHLLELAGTDPIEKQGQVRWYKKPEKDKMYLVGLDPSLGTGGDFAALQVFEVPSMIQVAEWQNNRTPVQKQVGIMREVVNYLSEMSGSDHNVYYSVENNTLGEAALVSISELGEENIRGIFLHEPKKLGTSKKFRKGFTTTHRSKVTACLKFKSLVENKKISIRSKNLVSEIKNFVTSGVSFAAKAGETDDLVMATILVVRMSIVLQSFHPEVDDVMKDSLDTFIPPMPFVMVMS